MSVDGLITSLSSTAEQLIGYSAHELVGRPITVMLADRSAIEISQMMKSAIDWGMWEGEILHRNRSGKSLRARASLTQLAAHRNGCAGFLLLAVQAPQSAGDASGAPLNEVAAHLREIAHELNNPLAVMMGFTQLILLDLRCEGKMRADVERLYSEMKRIIQVVERLHGYSVALQETLPDVEPVCRTS
jgi:PAS domain S-box-containing protein